MADSKKYIGIYDSLEDVQDALDNGQLSNPYVAKTMDNGQLDYNSLSPVDYSQYWCTYYPLDAKIYVKTKDNSYSNTTEYTGGDGRISKADFPNFYRAGSGIYNYQYLASTVTKFKYFQFDSTSATTDFSNAWDRCESLTEFPLINTSKGTNFDNTWNGCRALTEFPLLDLSKGTNFRHAWDGCESLTEFPLINTSKGTDFSNAWSNCISLTSFPLIDTSKGTDFNQAWSNCSALTTFPALDLSSGTNFSNAWIGCSAMTTMSALDLSNATNLNWPFGECVNLVMLGGFGAVKESIDLSPCPKLTVESLMNVINQAATVTGKTMTLGSTNLAKLSDEQKSVATSKGWTLA